MNALNIIQTERDEHHERMIHFWAVTKGTLALASLLMIGIFAGAEVGNHASDIVVIGRDTPVSLEGACIVGGVVLTFALWINRKFVRFERDIDELKRSHGIKGRHHKHDEED